MNKISVEEVDGRRLYYVFVAGAQNIIEHQVRLNRINVFPVRDGDTGANMAATLRAVIESVRPQRSYKRMLETLAESSLLNARGNSGIIFAQFLYGICHETAEVQTVSFEHFADSLKQAVGHVYSAVANPVEGTMLTVIRAWADFVHAHKHSGHDFTQVFAKSRALLETALARTTSQLPVLQQANVVDAGANAFVYFIDGIINTIHAPNFRALLRNRKAIQRVSDDDGLPHIDEQVPETVEFRYCTEAVLRHVTVGHAALSKVLQPHGNSLVIAGAEQASRLHIHTNDPARLFDELRAYGTITFQKADDMLRQSQAVYRRVGRIAVVTDSACDLSQELLDRHQIHLLPINLYFGDNHYLDKITIRPEQFYQRLDEGGDYPKTSQVNEIAFRNLYAHLASHYEAVIAVHLTSKFSGTCFNSRKAAEAVSRELGTPIAVIDSKNLSGGLGLLVLRVAQAIERGEPYEAILRQAEAWVRDTRIFVSVRTLKYMVRGGRVSPLKGFAARLLNLNPIIAMDDQGTSTLFGKAFSQRANMEKVMAHIQQISRGRSIWNYIVLHAENLSVAGWYTEKLQALAGKAPVSVVNISPVIGAHAGLGAASVALMFE